MATSVTEWEKLWKISARWRLRVPIEHIYDTEVGLVRPQFLDWLIEAERVGDGMNEKLKAVRNYIVKLRGVEEKVKMTGSSEIANHLEKILEMS